MAADEVELEVGNRSVRISNPGRVYFPARGETKLDWFGITCRSAMASCVRYASGRA